MFKDFKWFQVILCGAIGVQLVLVIIAEYNDDYIKAIYEMLWAILFTIIIIGEKDEK